MKLTTMQKQIEAKMKTQRRSYVLMKPLTISPWLKFISNLLLSIKDR